MLLLSLLELALEPVLEPMLEPVLQSVPASLALLLALPLVLAEQLLWMAPTLDLRKALVIAASPPLQSASQVGTSGSRSAMPRVAHAVLTERPPASVSTRRPCFCKTRARVCLTSHAEL